MRILILFFFVPFFLIGQKHDNVWLLGYSLGDDPQDSLWGTSVIDFGESPPMVYYDGDKHMDFQKNNISISDKDGEFLFSGDGHWLQNFENRSIEGDNFFTDGRSMIFPGSCLVIPLNEEGFYGYFHSVRGFCGDICGKEWWYSVINMNENNGRGKVLSQNRILSDSIETAKIMGVKHANGKDWWFLTKKFSSNYFYKIFFDGNDFDVTTQIVGDFTDDGYGQSCFSPDGSKYANAASISTTIGNYLDVYDFNRCSGELSNHTQIHSDAKGISGGIAFSPNSRFLYVSDYDRVLQYDTWAQDLLDSEVIVAEYDGYLDSVDTHAAIFVVSTYFSLMQNGPDDKIYIGTPNSSHYFHVIESPNEKGVACNVRQHALRLPTVNESIPTFPHYRLEALEGSPCDTLLSSSDDLEVSSKINIYPNPTNGDIQIEWKTPVSQNVSFTLYNLSGKLVYEKNFLPQGVTESINLNSISSGMYIYKLRTKDHIIKMDRLVIMK